MKVLIVGGKHDGEHVEVANSTAVVSTLKTRPDSPVDDRETYPIIRSDSIKRLYPDVDAVAVPRGVERYAMRFVGDQARDEKFVGFNLAQAIEEHPPLSPIARWWAEDTPDAMVYGAELRFMWLARKNDESGVTT